MERVVNDEVLNKNVIHPLSEANNLIWLSLLS
jgi:hypothetical protein